MIKKKKNVYMILMLGLIFFAISHVFTIIYIENDYKYKDIGLLPFLLYLYQTEAPKFILSILQFKLIAMPNIVWKILDIGIMISLIYSLGEICLEKDAELGNQLQSKRIILLGLVCSYPFTQMGIFGWIETTINYSWPLGLGLFVIVSLIWIARERKIRSYQYILFVASLIITCNSMPMASIMLIGFIIALRYYRKNAIVYSKLYIYSGSVIILVSLAFSINSLVSAVYGVMNAIIYDTESAEILGTGKFVASYTGIFENLLLGPNLIFFILCAVLMIGMFYKSQNRIKRTIACVPVLVDIFFTSFFGIQKVEARFNKYILPRVADEKQCEYILQIAMVIAFTVVILSIIMTLCWTISQNSQILGVILLALGIGLLIGIGSSVLTPTLVGHAEVYIYIYFAMISTVLLLLKEVDIPNKSIWYKGLYICCVVGALLNLRLTICIATKMRLLLHL